MSQKIILAIVGSRHFSDYSVLTSKITEWLAEWDIDFKDIDEIVSGGASGVDKLAERFAAEHDKQIKIFYPDWNTWGPAAGPIRNTQIINYCTHLVAFPSKTGKGTQDSIGKALAAKKITKVHIID